MSYKSTLEAERKLLEKAWHLSVQILIKLFQNLSEWVKQLLIVLFSVIKRTQTGPWWKELYWKRGVVLFVWNSEKYLKFWNYHSFRFDDIFEASRYTKALESITKKKKEMNEAFKEIKRELETHDKVLLFLLIYFHQCSCNCNASSYCGWHIITIYRFLKELRR